MLLLLCAVTTWAQVTPTAGNWYHIKNVNAGLYMQSAKYNQGADGALQMGSLSNSDAQKFYLEDAGEGKFFLKQHVADTDYYVLCNSGWNFTVSSSEKTTYTIDLVAGETDIYSIARPSGQYIGADATSNGASLYGDKGIGNNGKWQFEECDGPFIPTPCDFSADKTYRLRNMTTGLYLECEHPYWTGGEGAFVIKDKSTSDRQLFKIETAGEGQYNLTFTTDDTKFYMNASGWNFFAGAEPAGSYTIDLVEGKNAVYTIQQTYSSYTGFAGTNNGATTAGSKLYCNQGAGNDNIKWAFEEYVEEATYSVVYNFSYNDSIFATTTVEGLMAGSSYPAAEAPFGFACQAPAGLVSGNDTITVNCTVSLPFEFAATTDAITKWYNLKLKGKYIQYLADDNTYIEWADDTIAEGEELSHLWAFVGNPLNGFKIVNSAAGENQTVTYDIIVAEQETPSTWIADASNDKEAGTFSLYNPTKAAQAYMNAYHSGRIDYWDNDPGCKFVAELAPEVTITYNFVYGADSTAIGSATATLCIGNKFPTPAAPYGFTAVAPEGRVIADTTIVVVCEDNLPFQYAASVEEVKHWYFAQYHSNNKKYIKPTETNISWADATVDAENETAYMWAFIGNPVDGFKVYNKGTEGFLTDGDEVTIGEGSVYAIKPTRETSAGAQNGFTLWSNEKSTYVNASNGKLAYWWDNDAGSTVVLTEVGYTINYSYTYNETEVGTYSATATAGSEYPAITNLPYGFAASKPEGTVEKDTTIVIACTENLPFQYAASANEITKWYFIKMHSGANRYINYVEENTHVEFGTTAVGENKDAYAWAFVGDILNGFKLVNRAAGTTLALSGSGVEGEDNTFIAIDEAVAYAVKASAATTDGFTMQHPETNNYLNSYESTSKLSNWRDNGNGSTMFLADVTHTVNYSYIYNDTEIGTYSETMVEGSAYPAISNLRYGFVASKPEGIVEKDTTIAITCEENLPFEYAASVEAIKSWYLVQYHSNSKKYIYAAEAEITWQDEEYNPENKGIYAWAFVGNPIDGFKVYNYSTKTAITDGDIATMGDGSVYTVKATAETSTAAAHGFTLWSNEKNTYLNANNGHLAYWGSADAGSTLVLTEIAMTKQRELELLIASIEAENIVGSAFVGEPTIETAAALEAAIEAASQLTDATDEDIEALQAARNAIELNELTAGTYMIVNAKPAFEGNKVMTTYARCGWYGTNNNPGWTTMNTNDPLQYFTLEATDVENSYYIKTMTDEYISSATTLGEATAAEFVSLNGIQFNIIMNGGMLHANLHGYGVDGSSLTTWDEGLNSPSAWKLMKVASPEFAHTINVTAAGYATLNLAFTASIPEGVTCYVATSKSDTEVKMTAIEGVLPANTPVIIKANQGDYIFYSTDETNEIEENLLSGSAYKKDYTDANYTYYVLANIDGVVGLYPDAFEGDKFSNGANKVFFMVEKALGTAGYSFNFGGTTNVEDIVIAGENDVIYDVTGKKIETITAPGLYIINGVKTIVK